MCGRLPWSIAREIALLLGRLKHGLNQVHCGDCCAASGDFLRDTEEDLSWELSC